MIDDIQILSDSMYGVMEKGVQTLQKPIPEHLKPLSDKKLRLELRRLENMPEVEVAEPLPFEETPAPVAYHEHPQYLSEMPTHSHEMQPHIHLMGDDVKERFETNERLAKITEANLLKVTGELRGDMLTHEHPGYAEAGHRHPEVAAALSSLETRISIQEQHTHQTAHEHEEYGQLAQQILRQSEVIRVLENSIEQLTNRVIELEQRPVGIGVHTHDEYAKAADLESHLSEVRNRAVYYTAELSNEERGGKRRFIVEEAPR